jgi:hypothetical protein
VPLPRRTKREKRGSGECIFVGGTREEVGVWSKMGFREVEMKCFNVGLGGFRMRRDRGRSHTSGEREKEERKKGSGAAFRRIGVAYQICDCLRWRSETCDLSSNRKPSMQFSLS